MLAKIRPGTEEVAILVAVGPGRNQTLRNFCCDPMKPVIYVTYIFHFPAGLICGFCSI